MRTDDRYDVAAIAHANAAMTGTIARFAVPSRTAVPAIVSWGVLLHGVRGLVWYEISGA